MSASKISDLSFLHPRQEVSRRMTSLASLGRAAHRAARPTCACGGRARRRPKSTSATGTSSSTWPDCQEDVSAQLREVMRNVPQPVAVAVTHVPQSVTSPSKYHGATLTSFTSLTLHPYPLVAFSLRLPSRMADCLRPWIGSSRQPPDPSRSAFQPEDAVLEPTLLSASGRTPPRPPPSRPRHPDLGTGFPAAPLTVSLMSTSNTPIADALSRYSADQSPIFASPEWSTPRSRSSSAPALLTAIGSLNCEVVQSIPLRDLCNAEDEPAKASADAASSAGAHGSELFICRVLSVEKGSEGRDPLLHYQQRYVGVSPGDEDNG